MESQNQNTRYLIIGVLALIIVGVVVAIIALNSDSEESTDTTPSQSEESPTEQPANQQIPTDESTDSNPADATTSQLPSESEESQAEQPASEPVDSTSDTTSVSQPAAQYTDYTTGAFNQAIQENKNVVLFFHANWCPTCRALDEDIQNGLSRVPTNTEIFKIDYDNSCLLYTSPSPRD